MSRADRLRARFVFSSRSVVRFAALSTALAMLGAGSVSASGRGKKQDLAPEDALVEQRWLDVAVHDARLYTVGTREVRVEAPDDPLRFERLERLTLDATPSRIRFHDDVMYLAAGRRGLLWFERTETDDGRRWTFAGRFDTPGNVLDARIRGTLAYLADGVGGVRVVDLSDPLRPRQLEAYSASGAARALAIEDDLLAVAEGATGVRLFRVAPDGGLRPAYRIPGSEGARDVAFANGLLLVARGVDGLSVYRTSAVRAVETATFATPDRAAHVLWAAPRAFVSLGRGGVQILELRDGEPVEISRTDLPRGYAAERMTLDGERLYVAMGVAGVAILNVREPELPTLLRPRGRVFRIEGLSGERDEDR